MSWSPSTEDSLLSVSREAMKGNFEILFSRKDYPQGTGAAMDALDEVERLERILSVFRFDSRVRYINLTAHEEPVRIDDELFELISRCRRFAEATDGAVDITSGPLWKIWGFAKRDGRIPSEEEIQSALNVVGYRYLELDPEEKTVRFTKPGVELNFGCVGKGFALDVGAKRLRAKDVDRFLFQGELSSILVSGDEWKIGVAHPMRPGKRLAELVLADEALGTSGSQKQFFRYKGHRYSHLIDPRTGRPAEGVLSVTVLAPNGTEAELLSTAFFILGPDFAEKYCTKFPEISALLILPSEKRSRFEIQTIGFSGGKLRFLEDVFHRNLPKTAGDEVGRKSHAAPY